MSDIVERLKGPRTEQGGLWPIPNLHEEAVEEIERLRSIIAKDPKVMMIAYESGDHQRLGRAAGKMTNEIDRLRAENEKLRAALKPFADMVDYCTGTKDGDWMDAVFKLGEVRAAAATLKETGDEKIA